MNQGKSTVYEDYPRHPYISAYGDLKDWEKYPDHYPYRLVPKSNMELLDKTLFPDDIVMLWRTGLNNFNNHRSR